jgi:hypothetical protein
VLIHRFAPCLVLLHPGREDLMADPHLLEELVTPRGPGSEEEGRGHKKCLRAVAKEQKRP